MVEANPDCIAVVADIHGNLPALEAVVADLATRDVSHVINLGDHVSGPLWPRETAALLMDLPGSIGLPAFDSDDPQPHRIETGAAVARYAILRRIGERWEARQMTIEYDHEAAARRAEQAERADWAQALRTGRLAE